MLKKSSREKTKEKRGKLKNDKGRKSEREERY